ncbi:hypothetical protein NQ176_g8311 [Zarea fungicola]|uniref:Uncharacterized protein n=1 Tax=Zarea fungicola TaxID=93591 RepID=A0ACC1MVA4_9HYPO|nr:hypothetical protein NQ176_g8311 [Lecanicillium fungicola]
MSLLAFPAEVILLIAESLSSRGDINALVQCSRFLHRLLHRFLYLGDDRGKYHAAEWAVYYNYPPTLRILKNLGISLHDCDGDLLHIAAEEGNLEVLEYILDTGEIDIESIAKEDHIDTPLIEAAHHGQTDVVKLLLDRGAKPSRPGVPYDALIVATDAGNEDIVKLLLAAGADIHSRDHSGMTAVLIASSKGMPNLMTLLLDSGADIFSSAPDGRSLLQLAATGDNGQRTVEILLERGALAKGEDANELLRSAVMAGWGRGVCEMLIQKGADVNYKVEGDSTPLLVVAIVLGSFDLAAMLIHNGASVNAADLSGHTALHHACAQNHIPLVKQLLAAGADVSATTSYGEQPLESATNIEIVKMLLAHGAECRHVNNSGSSALITAISDRRLPMVKLLLESGPKLDGGEKYRNLLRKACKARAPHIVNLLLQHGPASFFTNGYASKALRHAASAGYSRLAESLVQHGASQKVAGQKRSRLSVASALG